MTVDFGETAFSGEGWSKDSPFSPFLERRSQPWFRTIPTRVGRTCRLAWVSLPGADHPHACGENTDQEGVFREDIGPSPRVWGEQRHDALSSSGLRTIPTRVGRTTADAPSRTTSSDHPHACGENRLSVWSGALMCGPSPRVWGELRHHFRFCQSPRTIPTRVGRTSSRAGQPKPLADHPHACGENPYIYQAACQ